MAELPIKYVKDKNGKFSPITSPNAVINEYGKNINELFISYENGIEVEVEVNELLEKVYPIGSIYISTNGISPASFLGGVWSPIEDRFLLGKGISYSLGDKGGEAEHTLTVDEMPNHRHNVKQVNSSSTYAGDTRASVQPTETSTKGYNKETTSEGGGQPHNNMPPYQVVAVYERIE